MSKVSSMTSIPSRSQASSIAVLIGLWALRIALKPASLSRRTLRSSARAHRDGAEGAVVGVDAGAAQFHDVAVDAQAVLRVELQRADAEGRRSPRRRPGRRRVSVELDVSRGRRLGAPQRGLRHVEAAANGGARTGQQRDG